MEGPCSVEIICHDAQIHMLLAGSNRRRDRWVFGVVEREAISFARIRTRIPPSTH
jgi:hypothetical protein